MTMLKRAKSVRVRTLLPEPSLSRISQRLFKLQRQGPRKKHLKTWLAAMTKTMCLLTIPWRSSNGRTVTKLTSRTCLLMTQRSWRRKMLVSKPSKRETRPEKKRSRILGKEMLTNEGVKPIRRTSAVTKETEIRLLQPRVEMITGTKKHPGVVVVEVQASVEVEEVAEITKTKKDRLGEVVSSRRSIISGVGAREELVEVEVAEATVTTTSGNH